MTSVPPPPRRIRAVRPRPVLRWAGWAFVAAVFGVTVLLALAVVHELAFSLVAREVTAEVASLRERPNRRGTYDRVACYTYALPGQPPRADRSLVSWDEFRRLSEPFILSGRSTDDMTFGPDARVSLAVRAYALGPIRYSRAVGHAWSGLFLIVPALFLGAFGLLSLALYRAAVVLPKRRRRLYTHGAAAPGTVAGGEQHHSVHGSSYAVLYDFTPAGAPQPIRGGTLIRAKEFNQIAPGQTVTVLYDPDKPSRNTAYEYGGYQWD
jgi:hypothetical protein